MKSHEDERSSRCICHGAGVDCLGNQGTTIIYNDYGDTADKKSSCSGDIRMFLDMNSEEDACKAHESKAEIDDYSCTRFL